jgi:hypothetical protein
VGAGAGFGAIFFQRRISCAWQNVGVTSPRPFRFDARAAPQIFEGCMVKDYPWHLQNFQLLKAKGIGKQTEAMRSPCDLKKGKKRQRLLFETYDVLVKM